MTKTLIERELEKHPTFYDIVACTGTGKYDQMNKEIKDKIHSVLQECRKEFNDRVDEERGRIEGIYYHKRKVWTNQYFHMISLKNLKQIFKEIFGE
ncbi:MAG: hypothetical protein AABY22_03425 [Nanoarchaeota archaeon]